MKTRIHKYLVAGIDLSTLRNQTEEHVAVCMRTILEERGMSDMDQETLRDAYAYALNQLPCLYPGQNAAGLADPVRAWDIHTVVDRAIQHVLRNPKQ